MANSGLRDLNYYFRQPSFAGGEISEDLWGRTDYAKYDVSVSDSTNMYSLAYGGIISRAGTEFIYDLGSSDNNIQLIPFQFNSEQQYMLAFSSDGNVYFFTKRGYVINDDGNIYTIQHTISPSDIGIINYVQSADTMFLCSPQSGVFKLERFGDREFKWSNFSPDVGAFADWSSTDTYLYTGTYSNTIQHGKTDLKVPNFVSQYSYNQTNPDSSSSNFKSSTTYSSTAQIDPNTSHQFPLSWDITPMCFYGNYSFATALFCSGYTKIVLQGSNGDSWTNIWSKEFTEKTQQVSPFLPVNGFLDYVHWTGTETITVPSGYSRLRMYILFNPYTKNSSASLSSYFDKTISNCSLSIPAWTETWSGTDINVLRSSDDLFTSDDIGRTVMLTEAVSAHEAHFSGDGTSEWLPCKGDWSIIMSGSFNGTITVQKSRDKGETSENLKSWNVTDLGSLEDSGTEDDFCYIRLVTKHTNDTGVVQLNADSFVHTVYAKINSYVSPTEVIVSFTDNYNKNEFGFIEPLSRCYNYALSAWSQALGYPRCVTLFQDRLVFASSPSYPLNVWISAVGDYYDFKTEIDDTSDDGAISLTLTSQTMNNINSLISKNDLLCFSEGGVWKINSRSSVTGFTAETAYAQQQNFEGSKHLMPLLVSNNFLYVLDLGSTVRDLAYSYNQDSYIGDDITLLSRHLFAEHEVVSWCYAQEPDSLVYVVRDDGVLLTLTYVKDQEVFAWSKHITQGKYKSVGSIRGSKYSDVYFIVERNGKNYIEVGANRLESNTTNLCFMDCSSVYQGEEATKISGLDYLEGYTVQILADGSEYPEQTVHNGSINLYRPAKYVRVGLGYNKSVTTLDLDIPRNDGTGFARKKSVGNVKIQFRDSYGGVVTVDSDDDRHRMLDLLPTKFNEPLVLQSATKELPINANWIKEAKITVSSDRPVPLNVLAIMADIAIGG